MRFFSTWEGHVYRFEINDFVYSYEFSAINIVFREVYPQREIIVYLNKDHLKEDILEMETKLPFLIALS